LWVWLSRVWSDWRTALAIVQPETVIAWHRAGFRLFWTWKVRRGQPGRPLVSREVRDLIRKMCREIRLGAPRIHGEPLKLGIDVGESSVSKYMVRCRKRRLRPRRAFLENHAKQLVSIDFFTMPTIHFQFLYVFLVLAHDRRRILHSSECYDAKNFMRPSILSGQPRIHALRWRPIANDHLQL
jgi:putative transposase